MRLSLIIPTYNRPHDIARLLRNLNFQTRKPDEVVIVDASDTDETKQSIERNKEAYAYPLNYYSHEKGLTRQRNFGVSKAKGEIIGFTDDDSLFEPDYFERILLVFEKDKAGVIGGASGRFFNVGPSNIQVIDDYLRNGPKQAELSAFMERFKNTGKDIWSKRLRKGLERVLFLHKGEEGTFCPIRCRFYGIKKPFVGTKTVDFLVGIAFYRKKVFEQVQYSDFFQGYGLAEDVHFSLQVGKNYQLVVAGEAICYHLHAPSGRPDLFKFGYMSSVNYFFIFKTYEKRNMLSYLIFWYFYCINALLDFLPALVGKNSLCRIKLFLGRICGGFSCIFTN